MRILSSVLVLSGFAVWITSCILWNYKVITDSNQLLSFCIGSGAAILIGIGYRLFNPRTELAEKGSAQSPS
jgi:threonine/homoserine/homoserine lactone efflux protein